MAKKRIRIDMEDSDGARYDIKLEGNVTRDKVLKIFEMMDLMNIEEEQETTNIDSIGAKIWHIVDKFSLWVNSHHRIFLKSMKMNTMNLLN